MFYAFSPNGCTLILHLQACSQSSHVQRYEKFSNHHKICSAFCRKITFIQPSMMTYQEIPCKTSCILNLFNVSKPQSQRVNSANSTCCLWDLNVLSEGCSQQRGDDGVAGFVWVLAHRGKPANTSSQDAVVIRMKGFFWFLLILLRFQLNRRRSHFSFKNLHFFATFSYS